MKRPSEPLPPYSKWLTSIHPSSKADDGPNIAHKAILANYIINYSSVLDQIEGKPELYTLDRIEA